MRIILSLYTPLAVLRAVLGDGHHGSSLALLHPTISQILILCQHTTIIHSSLPLRPVLLLDRKSRHHVYMYPSLQLRIHHATQRVPVLSQHLPGSLRRYSRRLQYLHLSHPLRSQTPVKTPLLSHLLLLSRPRLSVRPPVLRPTIQMPHMRKMPFPFPHTPKAYQHL